MRVNNYMEFKMNFMPRTKRFAYWLFAFVVFASVLMAVFLPQIEVTEAGDGIAAAGTPNPTAPFGASFAPIADIAFPGGGYPHQVAYASQLNYVYVNTETSLFRIDINSNTITELFYVSNIRMAMTQDDQYLLILEAPVNGTSQVRLMNTSTNQITSSYTVPHSYFMTTVGNRLFMGYGDRIDVFNALTGQFLTSATSTSDQVFAISWDRTRLYVSTYDSKLWEYDISGGAFTLLQSKTIAYNLTSLAVTGDGSTIIGAVNFSPTIYRYRTSDLTLLDTIPTDYAVHGVGADDDYIYAVRRFYAGNSYLRAYDLVTRDAKHHYRPGSNGLFSQLVVRGDGTVGVFVEANPLRFQLLTPTFHGVALPIAFQNYCGRAFVDNFDSPDSGWPVSTSGSITYRYLNGEYNIFHQNMNTWGAATLGDSWQPGVQLIGSKGRIAGGEGLWGLLFGLNADWSDFYTFEILPDDQRWAIFHYTSASGWVLIDTGQSPHIHPTNMNELEISHVYGYASLQINDNTVHLMWNFPAGRVGLSGGSFTANTDARYDDYVFAGENCPIPTAPSGLTTFTSPDYIPAPPLGELGLVAEEE